MVIIKNLNYLYRFEHMIKCRIIVYVEFRVNVDETSLLNTLKNVLSLNTLNTISL